MHSERTAAPAKAEQVSDFQSKLTLLYEEWSQSREAMLEEMRRMLDRAVKVTELRTGFFEKLLFLSTGSFALSLTFLGSLRGHATQGKALVALGYLKGAWIFMLLCILFCWLHNLHRCNSVDSLSAAATKGLFAGRFAVTQNVIGRMSSLLQEQKDEASRAADSAALSAKLKELVEESQQSIQGLAEQSNTSSQYATWLGSFGILAIEVAFVLLLIFAIKNSALL